MLSYSKELSTGIQSKITKSQPATNISKFNGQFARSKNPRARPRMPGRANIKNPLKKPPCGGCGGCGVVVVVVVVVVVRTFVLHEGVCPATRTSAPNSGGRAPGSKLPASPPPLPRPDGGGQPWPCTCVHGPTSTSVVTAHVSA